MTIKQKIGDNRTGTARSRELCQEMISGAEEFAPAPLLDGKRVAEVRIAYAEEGAPIGSLPPPASVKQVGKTVVAAIKGAAPTVFIDLIGARLAFERNGVRLYQALLSKLAAFGSFDGGPSRAELEHILKEEHQHFLLLTQALKKLGADPTAMTPTADIEAVMTSGVHAVMVDPRTDLVQSLHAALIAELSDNDAWDTLVVLAGKAGEHELSKQFERACVEEREHLVNVRGWLAAHHKAA